MREIDAYHKMDSLYGMNYFFCFRKSHGYHCEQPFDFCPSCGDIMKKTLKETGDIVNK